MDALVNGDRPAPVGGTYGRLHRQHQAQGQGGRETDSEREACVESVYATDSPTPEMLDEFTLIMLGGNGPADTPDK